MRWRLGLLVVRRHRTPMVERIVTDADPLDREFTDFAAR